MSKIAVLAACLSELGGNRFGEPRCGSEVLFLSKPTRLTALQRKKSGWNCPGANLVEGRGHEHHKYPRCEDEAGWWPSEILNPFFSDASQYCRFSDTREKRQISITLNQFSFLSVPESPAVAITSITPSESNRS